MTEEEAFKKIPEIFNEITKHGYTLKNVDESSANLYYGDYYIGSVNISYLRYGDGNSYVIRAWTETRVIMTDKISFLKTRVSHNIQIKVNNTKWYNISEPDELKKFIEWETIVVKHMKTALAKKRRMELDVDFE